MEIILLDVLAYPSVPGIVAVVGMAAWAAFVFRSADPRRHSASLVGPIAVVTLLLNLDQPWTNTAGNIVFHLVSAAIAVFVVRAAGRLAAGHAWRVAVVAAVMGVLGVVVGRAVGLVVYILLWQPRK